MYITAKKSENLYGKTFGKMTYQSTTGEHHKGADVVNIKNI